MGRPFRRRGPPRKGRVDLAEEILAIVERVVPADRARLIRLRAQWDKIAPPPLCEYTWPGRISADKLWLNVHDNQWLHELLYWRQQLLTRIEKECPDLGIHRIDARLGALASEDYQSPPPPPPRPKRTPPLCENPPPETMDALNSVKDEGLRDVLAAARLMMGRKR